MSKRMDKKARFVVTLVASASCSGCGVTVPAGSDALSGVTDLVQGLSASGEETAGTGGSPFGGTESEVTGKLPAGADYQLTAAEKRMRKQGKNFDKTVWEGVLIGAAGGALWGAITGGDTSDVLKKAAIGAAVGGLAGAYIAHKQKQYSEKEDQLDSMIVDVHKSNEDAETLISSARTVLAEDKRRLAAVNRRYKQGAASLEDLQREKARVGANQEVLAKAAKGAKQQYTMFEGAKDEYKKENPTTNTGRFENELETYNEHIQTLDQLAEDMSVA